MRLQLALNVRDIDEAVAYYAALFDTQPHKRRPGYANFAIDAPPLKLVLFQSPDATERLHHLGVEVFAPDDVTAARRRLEDAGLVDAVEYDTTCCHATQDKVWSREPDGLRWEWYRITDDTPGGGREAPSATCCTGVQDGDVPCCA